MAAYKPYCLILIPILILLTASFHVAYGGVDDSLLLSYKHVVIRNDLTSKDNLVVHCKSGDSDLGRVTIPYGGSWGFRFRVNLAHTTRFYCHFTWPGQSKWFDIFEVLRDDNIGGPWPICRECVWSIDGDTFGGPCRIRRDGKPPFCFGWNPSKGF
ncbi:PREDICTED: uncharacterized protein LOC104820439 [Tarenaya hassleriana]|uniref:uncharacterized protein LOC104820439 n=1 Tax=Tarenaya hassleriana TaxID=28532 RepID=UPI00053C1DF6|nr:PREDICTED: uncharacterized protein LOC104820439 [Tarenaya hassleriana]